jgi:limonene-1,2-epoxide hydrolase
MPDYIKMMMENTDAFSRKDIEVLGNHLADDYASFRMEGGEAIKRTNNRDETLAVLQKMFDAVPLKGSQLERIMIVGDYVVAVEKDTFDTLAGEKTTTTLGVYHMQDGKMWRAYSFPIQEES